MKAKSIPEEIKEKAETIITRFNKRSFKLFSAPLSVGNTVLIM